MSVLNAPLERMSPRRGMDLIAAETNRSTIITVGAGACAIAGGAQEILIALEKVLARHRIDAVVRTIGCIGICAKEPLVDIRQYGQSPVFYANVTPERIERIVIEHLVGGALIREWVVEPLAGASAAGRLQTLYQRS